LEIEKSIWEKRVREDTSAKGLGLCDRVKREVCTKKGEGVKTLDLTVEYAFQLKPISNT